MCTWYVCICVGERQRVRDKDSETDRDTERKDSEQKIIVVKVSFLVYFDSRHNSSPELSSPEDRKGENNQRQSDEQLASPKDTLKCLSPLQIRRQVI